MMTEGQKKEYERLSALHAARKLTRSQGVLLAALAHMVEQDKLSEAFGKLVEERNAKE